MARHLLPSELPAVQPIKLDFLNGRVGAVILGKEPSGRIASNGIHQLHSELEVNLIVSGSGGVILGNRRYPLGPGMIVWIPGGCHHCHVERSGDWKMHLCICSQGALASLGVGHPLLSGDTPPPRRLSGRTFRQISTLFGIMASLNKDALIDSGVVFLLQVLWDSWMSACELPESPFFHPCTDRIIHFLSAEPSLSTDLLARRLGIDQGYLSRRFRRDVGISIQEYRNRIRIDRVLVQWRPDKNFLGLALEAGFGNYTHFHRVFVQQMGMSPRKWAKLKA